LGDVKLAASLQASHKLAAYNQFGARRQYKSSRNRPAPYESKKKQDALDVINIAASTKLPCCSSRCLNHEVWLNRISSLRKQFWAHESERARLDELITRLSSTVSDGKISYLLEGQHLCRVAYASVFYVSTRKLDKAVKLVRQGSSAAPHQVRRSPQPKADLIIEYLVSCHFLVLLIIALHLTLVLYARLSKNRVPTSSARPTFVFLLISPACVTSMKAFAHGSCNVLIFSRHPFFHQLERPHLRQSPRMSTLPSNGPRTSPSLV
jgi:hypothetical protein